MIYHNHYNTLLYPYHYHPFIVVLLLNTVSLWSALVRHPLISLIETSLVLNLRLICIVSGPMSIHHIRC